MGVLYPCFCTRKDIAAEIEAAHGAPHLVHSGVEYGPDGPLYPGTCRSLSIRERADKIKAGVPFAMRLNMERAVRIGHQRCGPLHWHDAKRGDIVGTPEMFGDTVLARKDVPTSYHLSVTLDDHLQGVNLVTRGEDLFPATHIHRLLQALLGLDVPRYHHHGLLLGPSGKRLAKRDQAETLRSLRETGHSPADVWHMAGFDAPLP